jgi:hypothetical protein
MGYTNISVKYEDLFSNQAQKQTKVGEIIKERIEV